MINFATAIEQGISAADDANTEQAEVNDVIKSLASSVEAASGDAVTLVITQRSLNTSNELLHSLAFVFSGTRYRALVLKGKNSPSNVLEVAKWGQEGKGYPIKIGISSDEYNCPNREALEHALLKLVSASEFGEAIRTVAARNKNAARKDDKSGSKNTNDANKSVVKSAMKSPQSVVRARSYQSTKASIEQVPKTASKSTMKAAAKPIAKTASTSTRKVSGEPIAKATAKPTAKATAEPAGKAATESTAKVTARRAAKVAVTPTVNEMLKPSAKSTARTTAKTGGKSVA
jgi:hypothetical protein